MFAERIKKIKEVNNYTNAQIGAMADVSEGTVRAWIASGKQPTIDKIVKLCVSLNVSSDYLLGLTDNTCDTISDDELKLLNCYRSLSKDEQIMALGDIVRFATSKNEIIKIAARDGSFTETTITNDDIENINNLPDVDDI